MTPRLINFMAAHNSFVLKLNFIVTDENNTHLLSTGTDGRSCLSSLSDFFNPIVLNRTSGPSFAQAYSKLMEVFIYTDNENRIRISNMTDQSQNRIVARCGGTPWDIDFNEYCTYVVMASSAGLHYSNAKRAVGRGANCVVVPIYEIDLEGDEKTFKYGLPMKEIKFKNGDKNEHSMKSFRTGVYVVNVDLNYKVKFNSQYDQRGVIASGGDGFFRVDRML